MYVAMFWICDENSVDNTGMFQILMNILTQCQRLFCFSPTPPARRLWVHKKLGGDTARTA